MILYALTFLAGAIGWTLVEYWLHRGWGHRGEAKNPFSVEHLAHHADVTYFAPTSKKVVATILVAGISGTILTLLFGLAGLSASLGFVVMYVTYEVIHRRLHTHPGQTSYGRWARRHHLYHHYRRPQLNHGVTSPIWDFVFRTLEVPVLVKVPRRNALPWMLDEAGELRRELAGEYELVGRKPAGEPA